ncbi:BadF/BadG/BcrA/BcrD ATPase family protein [Ahrensia sp. 13_GOM-1096m]|uniref:BadF/BadG/BcrA/BcrD ATPase family protein n=1 Tax=Ahrensia sp. 13_GOM-1096m TaxID=1380380 RepID=UPI000B26B731|nr:BadF/BadG/BcrA/BcrD ATPase family protein [Ahrensia sp. 13_GOM-1096m]
MVYIAGMVEGQKYYLGVDGGGTGCRACLCDANGNPLSYAKAGSANVMSSVDVARGNILKCCTEALLEAGISAEVLHKIPIYMGLAGAEYEAQNQKLRQSLPFENMIIETDAHISLEGAVGSGDGAAAIIGTGSIYQFRHNGVEKTIGGWGFVVGDLSGGAWLGRALLQEALLVYDDIHAGSDLTQKVLDQFENNPQKIVEFAQAAKPGDFGVYAPLVFEYADLGDTVGLHIMQQAIANIEETLDRILPDADSQFCMIGGLGAVYAKRLSDDYKTRLIAAKGDALSGAVSLAIQSFSGKDL